MGLLESMASLTSKGGMWSQLIISKTQEVWPRYVGPKEVGVAYESVKTCSLVVRWSTVGVTSLCVWPLYQLSPNERGVAYVPVSLNEMGVAYEPMREHGLILMIS